MLTLPDWGRAGRKQRTMGPAGRSGGRNGGNGDMKEVEEGRKREISAVKEDEGVGRREVGRER